MDVLKHEVHIYLSIAAHSLNKAGFGSSISQPHLPSIELRE